MKREPVVFAVAGMVFGFVLGYMVASWDSPTRVVSAGGPSAASPARGPVSGGALEPHGGGSTPLDPDEVKALESLAARDRSNVAVRIELGNLLMDHERFDEAARWYREAVALDSSQPDVLVDLGASLVNSGKAEQGLAEFEKALKLDPGHKKALFNKGIALMQTGRAKDAVAVWEGLLKRFPDDPQLRDLRDQIERIKAGKAS
jgi:tetratricopeptide (TPR) repeat protein